MAYTNYLSLEKLLVELETSFLYVYELGGATVYVVYTSVSSVQFTPEYTGSINNFPLTLLIFQNSFSVAKMTTYIFCAVIELGG